MHPPCLEISVGTVLENYLVHRVAAVYLSTWRPGLPPDWRDRLTPHERRLLIALASAWALGSIADRQGWEDHLNAALQHQLHPPLPSVEALAAKLPAGDPRPAWYAASLILRERRDRAAAGPTPIEPNRADIVDWDRLPGIGPKTARRIVARRDEVGRYRAPEDLLAVPGIGPATLDKVQPYLTWSEQVAPVSAGNSSASSQKPELNRVDARFLAELPGIGPKLATTIIRERLKRRGGFRAWTDVHAIKGIGQAKLRVLQHATRIAEARPGHFPGEKHEGHR